MAGKQTRGRQRIEMKQIENKNYINVAFSKRRSGIYNKSSELVTLCAAQVGVVVFSPAEKAYCFAHPSINAIANQFLSGNPSANDSSHAVVESYRRVRLNELNQQRDELINQVKAEKARGKVLKRLTGRKSDVAWWEAPMEELNQEELYQMKVRMEDLQQSLWRSINQRTGGEAYAFFQGQKFQNNPFATNLRSSTAPSFPEI